MFGMIQRSEQARFSFESGGAFSVVREGFREKLRRFARGFYQSDGRFPQDYGKNTETQRLRGTKARTNAFFTVRVPMIAAAAAGRKIRHPTCEREY